MSVWAAEAAQTNMLAKIVKGDNNSEFSPVAFPVLGGAESASRHQNRFVVPDLSELSSINTEVLNEIPVEEESADEISAHQTINVEEIKKNAHEEAARIIAQAESDAAAIAEAAYEKATQEIYAKFETEVAAKADEVRLELARTIENISGLAEEISARHEKEIVELALQIAKKIVGREVTIDREIAFTLVKVSLSKLHNRAAAEVHLSPEDFNFVQSHRERLDFRGALDLVEDKSISVGGCLIHTESGDIDARIESQFDEIAHGLFN